MLYQKYHNTITKLKKQDLWDRSKVRSSLSQYNLNMDNNSDKSTLNSDISLDINGT